MRLNISLCIGICLCIGLFCGIWYFAFSDKNDYDAYAGKYVCITQGDKTYYSTLAAVEDGKGIFVNTINADGTKTHVPIEGDVSWREMNLNQRRVYFSHILGTEIPVPTKVPDVLSGEILVCKEGYAAICATDFSIGDTIKYQTLLHFDILHNRKVSTEVHWTTTRLATRKEAAKYWTLVAEWVKTGNKD